MLSKVKDTVVTEKQTGIVYSIPCANCNVQYIGETGRTLQTRKREHMRSVCTNNVKNSALAEHANSTGHAIDWDNMKPLVKENRWCQRRWSEACLIAKTEHAIANRDCGRTLPHVYLPLVERF